MENNSAKHSIVLGGIGGDSHSVGLSLLRQALSKDYHVRYLGPQTPLEEFFEQSLTANLVMLSCMDGHARHYLKSFPEFIFQKYRTNCLWYLGGNLTIGESFGVEKEFLTMGFHRVFPKFVDLKQVVEIVERDLSQFPRAHSILLREDHFLETIKMQSMAKAEDVFDEKIDIEYFLRQRTQVLEEWRTGADALNMEETALFLKKSHSFPAIQRKVLNGERGPLIQPRCGVATVAKQIELFGCYKAAGADVLSYQVDSLTRNNKYLEVEEQLRAAKVGCDSLNGFPVINHGVANLRKIAEISAIPLQTRHSTRRPELLAEITYAGGGTSFEGGPICYNIPYYKNYPLAESLKRWQYVDRLTGIYHEKYGIILDREFFGVLTATLIPPSLAIAISILEVILAVKQGVKCVSPGYAEQGNRVQDIAAIRCMRKLTEEYLQNLDYREVQVNVIFHQYMAAFPQAPEKAEQLIFESAVTAGLSGATRVLIKSPVEAYKIPTIKDNAAGLYLSKCGIEKSKNLCIDEKQIGREVEIISKEVHEIISGVFSSGGSSLSKDIIKAFSHGLLDIPFAPSIYSRGEVMTARDNEGAVRYLSCGKLSFSKDIIDFNREKMSLRLVQEGLGYNKNPYSIVEKDVLQVARGEYDRWPLYDAVL